MIDLGEAMKEEFGDEYDAYRCKGIEKELRMSGNVGYVAVESGYSLYI